MFPQVFEAFDTVESDRANLPNVNKLFAFADDLFSDLGFREGFAQHETGDGSHERRHAGNRDGFSFFARVSIGEHLSRPVRRCHPMTMQDGIQVSLAESRQLRV